MFWIKGSESCGTDVNNARTEEFHSAHLEKVTREKEYPGIRFFSPF